MSTNFGLSRHGGLAEGLPRPILLLGMGAALLVLILAFAAGSQSHQRQIHDLQAQNQQLAAQLDAAQQQAQQAQQRLANLTACSDGGDLLSQVRDFLAKGQPLVAVGLAQQALTQRAPPLCPDSKVSMATLWYGASLQFLLAQPAGSPSQQATAPQRWQALEQQAAAYGVPPDLRQPLDVVTAAQNAGLWSLAQAAFLVAWQQHQVGAESVARYYSILRNEGHSLAFTGTGATTDAAALRQGEQLLVTATAIARAYHLPNAEAAADLDQLAAPGATAVVPDSSDPVLQQAPSS